MKSLLLFLVLLCAWPCAANAQEEPLLQVYSRDGGEYLDASPLPLHGEEWRWLQERERLIMGVPRPDNPPMDITLRANAYEGVTADIVGMLTHLLHIDIMVKGYPSRAAAIEALKRGEIDLLSASNSYEQEQQLLLTDKYIADDPAIYKNIRVKEREIKTIAVPEYYLPFMDIMRYLSDYKVKIYPSRYSALSAVAYGQVDAVMVDMISGNFIVNKFYQNSVQLLKPLYIDTDGFAFALNPKERRLKRIIDIALGEILEGKRAEVAKRWNGGGLSIGASRVDLTSEQWEWLGKREKIQIAVNSGVPPLSFLDVTGTMHGVVADLLQVIRAKLGVEIEVVPVKTPEQMTQLLDGGQVDAGVLSPSAERRNRYLFSRAFVLDPLSYVVGLRHRETSSEALLKSGTVAVVRGFISTQAIEAEYGKLTTRQFDKIEDALRCVANEVCDVTVLPLRVAKYYINSKFPDSLFITGELFDSIPISAAFAVSPDHQMLRDILDKVIAIIPPDELEGLSNRWRVSAQQEAISWQELLREFGVFIALILLLTIWVSLWGLSLRKQVRERRLVEGALSTQLKFIADLVDGTPHPIYARDQDGRLLLCNSSYASFFGEPKARLLGATLDEDRKRWPFLAPLIADLTLSREARLAQEGDHRLVMATGVVDVYHWVQPYYDLEGNVQGGIGGWIDVSERVRLLDELAVVSQEAQEANRAKTTFLATMSHEIRTPMNAIIGLLELALKRGRLHEEDQSSLTIAHGSAKDLLSLIGDILDISKIESGRLELAPEPHDIAALTASVVTVFNALAREKNLRLELTTGQAHWVQIDGLCYKQILSNLISNAIKYTEQGSVKVTLASQASDGWCTLQLAIRDTGIGIDPVEQARLFQPFRQASQPEHIQQSGTGLGLMISRTLCESMGGSLLLESEPGHGTRVCVEMKLPLADAVVVPAPPAQGRVMEQGRRLRVMVVDDHPANRLLVTQQLAYLGHDATAVESGEQALRLLADTRVDVVITDFNMPGMNGFELTRQYRAQERHHGWRPCVILGLTADARQEQLNEGQAAGMDDCLFKPVGLEALDHCLRQHMQREEQADVATCMQEIRQYLGPLTAHQSTLMSPLLAEFVRASDDDLLGLQNAAEKGAAAQFLDRVHRLKGGARIMGTLQLVATCSEIESWVLDERTLPIALARLRQDYEVVRLAATQLQSVE
ncbi:ATP-binding protein [Aeromonas rivipollensis]|uniref:ATP-binding protein n=1 Tax=Aeromonas rivipollensis TaxID=948519 RepID=UPI00259E4612|nr:transporter substrate-binding domain-containing protein [Aeromonas rivipollensis]MDM5060400.1 transporter substrate-binding domain-containing protein [Aeromonas rivipollensis]